MEEQENPKLYRIRHSLAHVMAQAVKAEYPTAKLGFGPPTTTGLFYDFDFGDISLHANDLKKIEKRMKKIISQKQAFASESLNFEDACSKIASLDEPYKTENIKNLHERGVTSFKFFQNGPFTDVCEGPHVENTGELPVKAFKLDRLAGAYWLGSEKNKMLTRIYALAFETPEELAGYLKRRKMAEDFDHKKLGKELSIFHIEDIVGKGLPLWLPNGTVIRDCVENYAKEMEFLFGYKRVSSPMIAKEDLYKRSQHLPAYEESMYPPMTCDHEDTHYKERYYLKPMNCPHHHLIYGSTLRSYRELPLRLAEYGTCHRFEQSGELSGLLRVRGMTLNDAHIYCRIDQVKDEIRSILKLHDEFYRTFKLKDYKFRLSLRSEENAEKYKGPIEKWDQATKVLYEVLDEMGKDYVEAPGEAAFYGPKIDVQFKNLLGREETLSTIQVDFLAPINFNLKYIDEEGKEQTPVVLHRGPLSTHERFISLLLEYYGGAFPTWCAPTQVMIIPVNDTCLSYCLELKEELHRAMVRIEVDQSQHSLSKKIRTHTTGKIPNVLVIGNKEVDNKEVTWRRYGSQEQETLSRENFISTLHSEIRERTMSREPMSCTIA